MTLSAADIAYVQDLVHQRSAIVIDPSKAYLIESRLDPLARDNGLGTLSDLVSRLRSGTDRRLRDLVVDAMTTNETSFFRDIHPWTALQKVVIPQLLRARAATRSLTIWSAACSSGQEPYTLAMLLKDHFPEVVADWNVRIIATELSAEMLGRAAAGRFTQLEVNRGLPASMLVRHFTRDGAFWQVNDDLRAMVEFRALNLVEPWPFVPGVDVAFMRNVLIYFDLATKRQVLGRMRTVLRPDGYLFLGTAETTLNVDDGYVRVPAGQATTYQLQ